METFAYFAGINNLMNQTHKASAKRCNRIWKQILKERVEHFNEQTFYQFGVEYLRWQGKDGNIYEAVKEQVEFLGKDCFEWSPNFEEDEEYAEEFAEALQRKYNWLRQMEIM